MDEGSNLIGDKLFMPLYEHWVDPHFWVRSPLFFFRIWSVKTFYALIWTLGLIPTSGFDPHFFLLESDRWKTFYALIWTLGSIPTSKIKILKNHRFFSNLIGNELFMPLYEHPYFWFRPTLFTKDSLLIFSATIQKQIGRWPVFVGMNVFTCSITGRTMLTTKTSMLQQQLNQVDEPRPCWIETNWLCTLCEHQVHMRSPKYLELWV